MGWPADDEYVGNAWHCDERMACGLMFLDTAGVVIDEH